MPGRIPTACSYCGIRDCDEHRRKDERLSASRRGYDSNWRRLREQVLNDEPLCNSCLAKGTITPATDVHHKKPIRTHPELRLVRSNLVAYCAPCHNAINDYV